MHLRPHRHRSLLLPSRAIAGVEIVVGTAGHCWHRGLLLASRIGGYSAWCVVTDTAHYLVFVTDTARCAGIVVRCWVSFVVRHLALYHRPSLLTSRRGIVRCCHRGCSSFVVVISRASRSFYWASFVVAVVARFVRRCSTITGCCHPIDVVYRGSLMARGLLLAPRIMVGIVVDIADIGC